MVFLARVEGRDHRLHLAFRQRLVSRLVGRHGGQGQLSSLDRLRLREPGKIDFFDQFGQRLGLKHRTAQASSNARNEDLVESLDVQAIQLFTFRLAYHMAVLLSVG